MPTDPIVTAKAPISYSPFARSSTSEDWSSLAEFYGTVEAVDLVKKTMYITYQFDGAETAEAPGFRAGGWGLGGDPGFRWLSFITGISGGCTAQNLFTMPFGEGSTDWQYKPAAAMAGVTPGTKRNTGPNGNPPNTDYAAWVGDFGWDTTVNEGSIRKWYTWGIRKFWLHMPFGKVPKNAYTGTVGAGGAAFCPDALMYQPDSYICAKEGFVDAATGRTGNIPMPWITDDVVDGVNQGFVPLFQALISGSSAGLSQETWERLTGQNTGMGMWYNPADPIEVTVYLGTINGDTYPRWRRWFEADTAVLPDTEGLPAATYARRRLERSFEPLARAGMRVGFDALVVAPGPTLGEHGSVGAFSTTTNNGELFTTAYNIPSGTTFGKADAGWWKFFSEWVVPTFGKNNIFMEANPSTISVNSQIKMNPYVLLGGINVCTADEFGRAGFGGTATNPSFAPTASRQHYLEELGEVEYLNSLAWASTKPHVGSVDTSGVTLLNGKYWYLSALAEKPGIKLDDGSAYNSGLSPQITSTQMNLGADYLRLKAFFNEPGNASNSVPGEHIWGQYWAADHLAHRQRIGNGYTFAGFGLMGDPNPMTKDKTRPGIIFPFSALKRTLDGVMPGVAAFGITNDFQRAFSGITAFARFVAGIKSGKMTLDPLKSNTGLNTVTYPVQTTEIVQTAANNLALESRTEGIGGVMWLYPSDYDRYCSTGLGGTAANGSFHVPNTTDDIVERKLEQWLDMKIRTWYERFGKYPKYITWKLTEYDGSSETTMPGWQIMRFLDYPSRIPTTATETSAAIGVREAYHSKTPGVTAGSLENSGYGSSIKYNQSLDRMYPDLASQYGDSVFQINPLLQLTKSWRTKRGLAAKIGLYGFPFLPQDAYVAYGLSGSSAVALESAGWNDLIFPKGSTSTSNNGGGTFGWYTQTETADLKNRIRLEYRKRYEPVAQECEVVMPEILEYSSAEIVNDTRNEYYRAWHKELLNLAFDLKTKRAWDVTNDADNPPALANAEIIPVIAPAYMGASTGSITAGDPLTLQRGTLFDHDKMNYNSIDWIRDEYLRPVRGTPQKVQGMSVWSPYLAKALNASRLSGTNVTTDREWLFKWLKADQGAGITVNWNDTSGDAKTKTIQFFDVYRNLCKRYLKRFDAGQPRIDVLSDPYKHTPFAVGWNIGYTGSYPTTANGMAITDVHPLVWIGWTGGTNAILRTPGDTGALSSALFNDFATRLRKIPSGRRVVLPYYWGQDPISDQRTQVDFYKNTADGATYTGSLAKRTHETGTVKQITPWAYQQTNDARLAFQAFLAQCAATGATFDAISDDGESWTNPSVGSNSNSFSGAFGPTGMPALLTATGGTNHVFDYPAWLAYPDNRMVSSTVKDSRFSSLGNSYDGSTLGGAIERYYKQMVGNAAIYGNMGIAKLGIDPTFPLPADIAAVTGAQILEPFIKEGIGGISAATGPQGATSYAPPISTDTKYRYNVLVDSPNNNQAAADALLAANPWQNPWTVRQYTTNDGKIVNRYMSWYAQSLALEDLVMGDLYKKLWIDTIDGSTLEAQRRIKYSHYDISPTGITEGVFVRDYNSHHYFHGDYPWVNPAPALYGELGDASDGGLRDAKYIIFPRDNFERFSLLRGIDIHKNPLTPTNPSDLYTVSDLVAQGKAASFTPANDFFARSYIAMIRDLTAVRAMLRKNPNSWRDFCPWIWNPADTWWTGIANASYREDLQSAGTKDRTDVRYWNEMLYHCLVSGAKYFNYFNPGDKIDSTVGSGFTSGLIYMQGVLNTWKTVSEGYRVQPASNLAGNVSSIVDRIDISNAGGSHVGATGTVISGGKLLKFTRGKTAAGSNPNDSYLWRVTAAPQGTELIRLEDASRVLSDLPRRIDLVTGEVSAFEKMTRLQTNGLTGNGDYSKFFKNDGYVSLTETTGAITLSTRKDIVDSGAELRHAPTILAKDYQIQPVLLGTGREAVFTATVNSFHAIAPTRDWFTGGGSPNSRLGVSVVGFHQLGVGKTLRDSGSISFGIESLIGFYNSGGSLWRAAIYSKNPNTGKSEPIFEQDITGVSSFNNQVDLKVTVNADATQVKWFVNGTLKNIFTVSGENTLPIGTRAGNGLWAGCGVSDITLADSGSIAVDSGDVQQLIVNNMDFRLLTKSGDAQVTVSDHGAWIKRTASSEMPLYRISSVNPPFPAGILTPGTGFPANPDAVFTPDPNMNAATSDLADTSDLRVVAAWKDDPIPFDPTPSGTTLTVIAYHPSGIEKVEASLNGGDVVTRTGTAGVPYGEFQFFIPPVTGAELPLVNLPKTVAGATYGGLHEIRAKVFPFTGGTRILGGEPDAVSRYYTPVDNAFTIKKRDVNETSFFVQNIDTTNDSGYRLAAVAFLFDNPSQHTYVDLRNAINQEMVTNSIKYLDLVASTPSTLTIPNIGDEQNITIPGAANRTIRITGNVNGTTMAAATSPGDATNSSTSYNGANIGNIVTNWVGAASTTEFSLTNSGLKSYGSNSLDANGGIYTINTQKYNPLSSYNIGMAIAVSPSGNGSNNTDWLFQPVMNKNAWGVAVGAARVGGFLGVGKVKMKNVSFDKGSCPDLFRATSNQAVAFEGVTLMSTLQPSIDPYRIAANGNASFLNCTTHTSGLTVANAFGFSRYVVGCTATGVKGAVFSNASLVRNSNATASNKIEVRTSPAFFSRKGIANPLGAQGKKNNLYLDTVCSGDYADCISLGRNEIKAGSAMDHYDLLYKNLIFTGSTGMIDRIEGGVNGVYMTGISMPNALLFSPNYKTILDAQSPKFQKMYIDTTNVRMILNEGSASGNELAAPSVSYKSGFGVKLGTNIQSAGFSADITPRAPSNITMAIKGIPWKKNTVSDNVNTFVPGNILTPWFTITDSAGIKRFGLDMGGGYGSTASGNAPRGLSFGSWSREVYESAINPRLNWVYSLNSISWSAFDNSTLNPVVLGNSTNAYEQWIDDATSPTASGFVLFSGNLETFHRTSTKNATMTVDKDASKQWLMFHSNDPSLNSYNSSSDIWQQFPPATDVGSNPVNNAGNSGHWLNVGTQSAQWIPNQQAGIILVGSRASAGTGGITLGAFATKTATSTFLGGMNNLTNGGLTLTDQNGNLFRINPGSWQQVPSTSLFVFAPGSAFLYASGSCAGTSVVDAGNSGFYPREWSYNGDASNQYAPVKFEINLANNILYANTQNK